MKRQQRRPRPATAQQRPVGRASTPTTPAVPATHADRAVADGVQLHRAGRLAEAETHYRQALAQEPEHAEALHLLGLLAHQFGQYDLAVGLIGRAIISVDDRPWYYLNIGASLQALGRLDLAISTCRQAIALRPDYPEAFNNLGVALQAQGALYEAIPCFERAIALQPAYAEAHFNLGVARQAEGRNDLAAQSYRTALAHRPNYLAAHYNLGNTQRALHQYPDAVASFREVLAVDPNHVDAHNNLGVVLHELGERDAAIASFERTIALQPAYPSAFTNLGHALRERGRHEAAIQAYRRAIELQPDDVRAHSGLIFMLDHDPACTPALALAERRAWNTAHARALTLAAPAHQNLRDPHRPLRVGYVSGDFYTHSAAAAFGPIVAHDPRQVEVVCYSDVSVPDRRTAWFASQVPAWRNVAGWTDEAIAEQVRADRIDVLVDLGGHSASGRLLVFARKPAPIQVTAWGYITGTGLDAMDAMLVDPVVVPPDEHDRYAEDIVYLPSIFCLEPPATLPAVTPPPYAERGALTFGSFNAAYKLTSTVLDTWASIVAAVPDSRMVFKGPGLEFEENRARVVQPFAARGVAPERIEIVGTTSQREHLLAFGSVDVLLDSFPTGGGVTTFESLLLGVPCVTLMGDRISGRVSASVLTTVGLGDLAASTIDEYVAIATGLAARTAWLASQRTTLRERVLASPVGNRDQYARALEDVYRTLWQHWCSANTERGARSEESGASLTPALSQRERGPGSTSHTSAVAATGSLEGEAAW